jgi:hypothetical protein
MLNSRGTQISLGTSNGQESRECLASVQVGIRYSQFAKVKVQAIFFEQSKAGINVLSKQNKYMTRVCESTSRVSQLSGNYFQDLRGVSLRIGEKRK